MDQAMMQGAMIGAVIGGGVVVICLMVAYSRRGSVSGNRIGSRRLEVQSAAPPDAMFERLAALGAPYRVDDSDRAQRKLVLSTSPTFTTWGFFYPIEIRARPDGGSTIQVGIASKVFQYGPLVTRAHRKAVAAIETQSLPAARVVG